MDQTIGGARPTESREWDLAVMLLVEASGEGRARAIAERLDEVASFERLGLVDPLRPLHEELDLLVNEAAGESFLLDLSPAVRREVECYMDQVSKPHPLVVGPADVPFVCVACGVERPGLPIVVGDPLGRLGALGEITLCVACVSTAADEAWGLIEGVWRDRAADRRHARAQRRLEQKSEVKAEVLRFLRASSEPPTTSEIHGSVTCSNVVCNEVVAELVAEGVVATREVKRGRFRATLHFLVRDPEVSS